MGNTCRWSKQVTACLEIRDPLATWLGKMRLPTFLLSALVVFLSFPRFNEVLPNAASPATTRSATMLVSRFSSESRRILPCAGHICPQGSINHEAQWCTGRQPVRAAAQLCAVLADYLETQLERHVPDIATRAQFLAIFPCLAPFATPHQRAE